METLRTGTFGQLAVKRFDSLMPKKKLSIKARDLCTELTLSSCCIQLELVAFSEM